MGLLENTGPTMMFGQLGDFRIPAYEKIKDFLIKRSMPLDKIVQLMEFENFSQDHKIKALTIMEHDQLLTSALLKELSIKN